jgi:hypothetical protein
MKPRRDGNWVPAGPLREQLERHGAWIVGTFGLCFAAMLESWRPLAIVPALAAMGEVVYRAVMRGRVKGWRVDDDGVHEVRHGAPEVLHRWAAIQDVSEQSGRIILQSAQGRTTMPAAPHGPYLLRLVRQGQAQAAGEATVVGQRDVEGWLGLAEGASLVCRPTAMQRLFRLAFLVYLVVWATWSFIHLGAVGAILWVSIMPFLFGSEIVRQLRPVEVSAAGVRQGRRWIPWDHVTATGLLNGMCSLSAITGNVGLLGPHAARVHEAVKAMLAARERGAVLPRMGDIPDHAISRAETVDVASERGISRLEEPQ